MSSSNIENKANTHQRIKTREFSRAIDVNTVSNSAPFHWLSLAIKDLINSPLISISYGLVFSIIPVAICFLVLSTNNHLYILPSIVAFALIGPAFATGLYDVAWELEKGHTPTFKHSFKSMFRNPVGEWGFALLLVVIMIAWMRIATLIHVLYPSNMSPNIEELISFLAMGTIAGAIISAVVFSLSAFTPQIMVERRVDIMTALTTSVKAVNANAIPMLIWSIIIVATVAVSVLTLGLGFIITMPILALASWHAYIAVIKTKRQRNYE
tara:strand:- start:530 stop:1333 length:804 start_codon:yes stop_codon:yes gene_type:complete